MRIRATAALLLVVAACGGRSQQPPAPPPAVRSVLLITIDTLRADRVGAYGYDAARTPALDALAREGTRFQHAYATAPITLTSHASLMTGRYPPGHGGRHNGIRMDLKTPTLAEAFAQEGFATAAFVAAFPLDRRFGLIKGFHTYGDRMPRAADGRPANERPGRVVVDEALEWLTRHRQERFFLWVHLFEPHAPYGDPSDPVQALRPARYRYDEDVAEADRQVRRVIDALGDARQGTLIVATADHGEAFGEHGEISHSLFTYDITLRVPLIVVAPGAESHGGTIDEAVSLVDLAPTIAAFARIKRFDADGIDLSPALAGTPLTSRALYAESFAPLFDFAWSPLRTLRAGRWKYIAAPRPELYDLEKDPGEHHNVVASEPQRAADLARRTDAISKASPSSPVARDPETLARLQALGYLSGGGESKFAGADPKDKRELAARLAEVASGELHGTALERALREILQEDPDNPQANVRLGYVLVEHGRCADAIPLFSKAIAHRLPAADAHLGLAGCQIAAKDPRGAEQTLRQAERVEPDNPVVTANLGVVLSDAGRPSDGAPYLERALTLDPDLHQARFSLAIAYARLGRRKDAAREAAELLRRLPPDAPQRPEVARLLATVS